MCSCNHMCSHVLTCSQICSHRSRVPGKKLVPTIVMIMCVFSIFRVALQLHTFECCYKLHTRTHTTHLCRNIIYICISLSLSPSLPRSFSLSLSLSLPLPPSLALSLSLSLYLSLSLSLCVCICARVGR